MGERTKRFALTNGIFKAIQARETFLWWNTWEYECETPSDPFPTLSNQRSRIGHVSHFYCTNVKLGVYFLRLMRYNKFFRVLRLIKCPRKSGMERRWRRSSIIPWILLFERLNTGALQKLFDSYKHFKHIPSSLNTIEQISRIINRLLKNCCDIKLKKLDINIVMIKISLTNNINLLERLLCFFIEYFQTNCNQSINNCEQYTTFLLFLKFEKSFSFFNSSCI